MRITAKPAATVSLTLVPFILLRGEHGSPRIKYSVSCFCVIVWQYKLAVSGICIKFTKVYKDYINDDEKIFITSIKNSNIEIVDCGIINFSSAVSETI
jgi:hypothetical protein